MKTLKRVLKRGAVLLDEHVSPDLDLVIGAYAEDEGVERSMVDGAHRHAVRHDGFAALRVLLDVGRVEQPRMSEPAQCAVRPGGEQHAISEHALVQPLLHERLRVSANGIERRHIAQPRPPRVTHGLVQRHDELLMERFLAGQPDRKPRRIDAWPHPDEPDERPPQVHGPPKAAQRSRSSKSAPIGPARMVTSLSDVQFKLSWGTRSACYCMCMLERRLQILLDRDRYERVAREAEARGTSVDQIIREAIDRAF